MKRSTALSIALIVALHLGIQNGQARSDELDSVSSSESESTMFMDRDRLIRTLMRDDARRVDAIRDHRDAAQENLDRAIAADAPQEVIDELSMNLRRSQAALTQAQENFTDERNTITRQVNAMSEDQVVAMNRSLNNTLHNGLIPRISSDDVMRILDEDFNARQINAFTKAFEAEEQFCIKARRFEAKYLESGKEQFRTQANRFRRKADVEKAKFLAKIDRFDRNDEALQLATETLVTEARESARQLARGAAKESARSVARNSAKQAAKAQAREQAKQHAKAERGNAGRGLAKGKNK